MVTYYYWSDDLPNSPLDHFLLPIDFFNSLLSPKDKFSWIIDSKQENLNQLQGVRKNYGFEYVLGYLDDTQKNIIGIVLFVHTGSIAEKNGIQRGDIFSEINGTMMDIDNYENLLALEVAEFLFYRNSYSEDDSFLKKLSAENIKINPIQVTKEYIIDNNKIGYICYNQFILDNGDGSEKYKYDLLNCFEKFKNENINELILDFRYNPGGLIDLAVLFSSLIVPPNIDTTQIAIRLDYNNKLNELYHKQGMITDLKFSSYPLNYIGNQLKRVFIIIGTSTASTSEAVINSLLPYMEVILIGSKTYGKNYGSIMFTDQSNSNNQWTIQPIILKMLNADHKSDYDNGFIPDYDINEFLFPLVELGCLDEPLLNFTISIINSRKMSIFSPQKSKVLSNQLFTPIKYSINKQINLLPNIENFQNEER
jgi:C-terminal processing protease CtpA/Prc